MKLHLLMQNHEKSPYIKHFDHILKQIEKDFLHANAAPPCAKIYTMDTIPSHPWIRRMLACPAYAETKEIMMLESVVDHCIVEIAIPMGTAEAAPPFMMCITLPTTIYGSAEYRIDHSEANWYVIPHHDKKINDLQLVIPEVQFKYTSSGKKPLGESQTRIKFGHALEISDDQKTEWIIHSEYEKGIIKGRYHPHIKKYLQAIPKVISMIELWNQTKIAFPDEGATKTKQPEPVF